MTEFVYTSDIKFYNFVKLCLWRYIEDGEGDKVKMSFSISPPPSWPVYPQMRPSPLRVRSSSQPTL